MLRWSIDFDGKAERTRNDWLTQQLVDFIRFLGKNTYHSPQTYGEEMVGLFWTPDDKQHLHTIADTLDRSSY
jgi:hypothetical protein